MWDSLLQHALTAVYQRGIWYTRLQAVQMVPSPEGRGWCDMDCTWKLFWMTLPEATKACLELLKCGCKQECAGRCKLSVSKLISLVQGYVSVQENAAIINFNLILIECVPDCQSVFLIAGNLKRPPWTHLCDLISFKLVINYIFIV